MPFNIPSALRLKDLKTLAFKCGTTGTGTKSVLTQRLYDEITLTPRLASHARILSIDMGIRNLAYCVLDVPPSSITRPDVTPSTPKEKSKLIAKLPQILDWSRLAVSTRPEISDSGPVVKEAFDPATLSNIAYKLLRSRLLLTNPTHVLIERQRFRSMGGSHVLEWTLRVNMFESILHAVLCTLKSEGSWAGEVISVTPGKVGPFWLPPDALEEEMKKSRKSKSAKVQNKGVKIDLVRRWLEAGDVVGLGNEEVKRTVTQYVEKWGRSPGRVKGVVGGEKVDTGKLDDLADCLLQGMAWVRWEENKRMVLRQGVEEALEIPVVEMENVSEKKVKEKASKKDVT